MLYAYLVWIAFPELYFSIYGDFWITCAFFSLSNILKKMKLFCSWKNESKHFIKKATVIKGIY